MRRAALGLCCLWGSERTRPVVPLCPSPRAARAPPHPSRRRLLRPTLPSASYPQSTRLARACRPQPSEVARGTVEGALNYPLSGLRGRVGELPRDQKIYVFCQVGAASAYPACATPYMPGLRWRARRKNSSPKARHGPPWLAWCYGCAEQSSPKARQGSPAVMGVSSNVPVREGRRLAEARRCGGCSRRGWGAPPARQPWPGLRASPLHWMRQAAPHHPRLTSCASSSALRATQRSSELGGRLLADSCATAPLGQETK
mgnify:CR=1 FL=1